MNRLVAGALAISFMLLLERSKEPRGRRVVRTVTVTVLGVIIAWALLPARVFAT